MADNTINISETEINQNGLKELNQIISGNEKLYEWIINNQWFRDAVQGDADEQFSLGLRFATGDCVEKNQVEAAKWFRKAAEQGDVDAQITLGFCYLNGDGVKKNLKESAKWFRKAAKQNDSDAQFHLGVSYELGYGVLPDKNKAAKWYRKAARQGNEFAQDALDRLEDD